jgi:DNA-binding CsgD family transcriptional regulator
MPRTQVSSSGVPLSRREREVSGLVAEGLTNREIADRLFISERTADGHLEHIREKLGVNNRAQVAAWFVAQSVTGTTVVSSPSAHRRPLPIARVALVAATAVLFATTIAVAGSWLVAPTNGALITTVVGSEAGGYNGDGGPATSAQLSRPSDVVATVTDKGLVLYVADTDNGAVRRVDAQSIITTLAGGVSSPLIVTLVGGGFGSPFVEGGNATSTWIGSVWGIALDPQGLVYLSNGDFIAVVNPNRTLHRLPSDLIGRPAGLALAHDGSLYIADYKENLIWIRKPDGTISPFAGNGTRGSGGDNGSALAAELSYPDRIALDRQGNLYIADKGNNRIRRVDHGSGVITTVAGSSDIYGFSGDGGPAQLARLSLPEGIAVTPDGDLFIADTGNNRIRRVDSRTHLITTIAGTGEPGFAGDGLPATQARLYGPAALSLTPSGDLYIVDMGNNRIRVIRRVVQP